MKKRSSSHLGLALVAVLAAGFLLGRLDSSEPQIIHQQDMETMNVIQLAEAAVVSITAHSSPTGFEATGGSGFVVSEDGLVATSAHVVNDPEARYTVSLQDGREFEVSSISMHPITDLAVLHLSEASNLPTLDLADSDRLLAGHAVVAMGVSHGEINVSRGIVSSIDELVEASGLTSSIVIPLVIRTDAAIHEGNSGGPLLDLSGKVIGVNTALESTRGQLSFAIPINSLLEVEGVLTNL